MGGVSTTAADREESASVYRRWARGDCLCCGLDLVEDDDDGTACVAIGEGVLMCGHCISSGHQAIPGFADLLLRALIEGRQGGEP